MIMGSIGMDIKVHKFWVNHYPHPIKANQIYLENLIKDLESYSNTFNDILKQEATQNDEKRES